MSLIRLLLVAAIFFAWAVSDAAPKKGTGPQTSVPYSAAFPWLTTDKWRKEELIYTGREPRRCYGCKKVAPTKDPNLN